MSKLTKKSKVCPRCQAKYPLTDFEFCRYCGAKLEDIADSGNSLDRGESGKVKHRTLASWGWIPAVLGYTASFILLFLFQNILSIIGAFLGLPFMFVPLFDSWVTTLTPEFLVFITLGQLGLVVIPLLYLKIRNLPLKELGFDFENKKEVQNDIMIGTLGGGIMMGISLFVSWASTYTLGALYSPLDIYMSEIFSNINNASFMAVHFYQYVLLVISMFLLVAPSEEISTRAFLQQGLENSFGRWIGLIITAIIFSALHILLYPQTATAIGFPSYIGSISAIIAIPSYLALSLTLGFLLQIRKYRIITTITAHAVYMVILVSIYYFQNYWIYLYI